jgi:hypothetical protein
VPSRPLAASWLIGTSGTARAHRWHPVRYTQYAGLLDEELADNRAAEVREVDDAHQGAKVCADMNFQALALSLRLVLACDPESFGPKETRVGLIHRQEDKTRGSPKDGRTSLPNVVIAEMRRPDNVNTAIPLAWYRPVWGSRT